MFKIIKLTGLLFICFIFSACPFESPMPLDTFPTEKVDTSLTGYWYGIVKDGSDFFGIEALDITKQTDYTYNITRYGKVIKGDMIMPDTSRFTGYASHIGDQLYMNVETNIVEIIPNGKKEPEIKTTKIFYLAALTLKHDTLSVQTITDGFAGLNPNFHSGEDIRKTILSLKEKGENVYDDVYKLSYRKTQRPQPQHLNN
ncbi:MAG: hypothetical protein JST17_07255 [Bacteroidetes bacterium]|nr:hypothetical protein [Bacteroidota bacterium]MBS1931696.1 hypothetical protein [Bacteroidota bacterium]